MIRRRRKNPMEGMTPLEMLEVWTCMGRMMVIARRNSGHVAPSKGSRGMARKAKKLRHRGNRRHDLTVASRSATVRMAQGFTIEPAQRKTLDEAQSIIARLLRS